MEVAVKKHLPPTRNNTWSVRIPALLVAATAVAPPALGAERIVLCEEFTSVG
jgi:hypothetical protein